MLIPYQDLEQDTLTNLIESFILREGTDYGEIEVTMKEKCQHVMQQLISGEIVIIYSQLSESVTLLHKEQMNQNRETDQ